MGAMRRRAIYVGVIALLVALCVGYSGPSKTATNTIRASVPTIARPAGIVYSDASLQNSAATAINPRVYGSSTPDSIPGRYRYSVTLVNQPTTTNKIWEFVVNPIPMPITVNPPPHWFYQYGFQGEASALFFGSGEGDTLPMPAGWDSLSMVPSIYDLAPGDSVTFRYISDHPPAMVYWFTQAFFNDTPLNARGEGPPPTSIYTNGIYGTVVGPATATGVQEPFDGSSPLPRLRVPRPNPSASSATVAFYLPAPGRVSLGVYDVSGRLVDGLVADRDYPAGYHSVVWNGLRSGMRAASGVYFIRLSIDGKILGRQKMIMVR